MRAVIPQAWLEFTEPLEGGLNFPYADKLGLVTTGYGDLIDPLSRAMGLPWMIGDRRATGAEIAAAWWKVKNDPLSAAEGWRHAIKLTDIRLRPEAVHALVFGKLRENDAALREQFPSFEAWPACAQMALHSWAWACGPRAHYPKMFAALREQDFDLAAVEIYIPEDGPDHVRGTADDNRGLIPRNVANAILLRNASRVQAFKLDPDLLDWKRDLGVAEITTAPEVDNPASEPTIYCGPVAHVDPSEYLQNRDDDPDDAA